MSPEINGKKIPELDFKPEQVVTEDDPEFFEELCAFLESKGYKPEDLVYSGFDGEPIKRGKEIPRYPYIFAMNVPGWKHALETGQESPAVYAFGVSKVPVLGLYEKSQLADARPRVIEPVGFDEEGFNYNQRIQLDDIEKRENLADLPDDKVIDETVVHKDFPDGSPTDALVGLVFLDRI